MNERSTMRLIRTRPSRDTWAIVLTQAVAAFGILLQFLAKPELFAEVLGVPFPPGLVYVAGATVVIWLDQGSTWSPMGAIALSMWIVLGGLISGDLITNLSSADVLLVVGNVVMVAGLLVSSAAGAVAIAHNRRVASDPLPAPLSARNPRLRAHVVTVGMIVAAAGTLAVAESFEFRGGGPYPLLILAVATAFVRGRYPLGIAIVFAIVYFGSAVTDPVTVARLADPSETAGFVSTLLHLLSLLGVLAAGSVANMPADRASK